MHEEGERPNIRRFKAKSIAKQPIDILGRQRAEPKFAYGVSVCRTVSNAPRKHDRLVKFVDHGRLANARRARYQHELRPAMSYDTVKASSRIAISRSRP